MCVYEHEWDYRIGHVLCVYEHKWDYMNMYMNMIGIIGLVMYVCVQYEHEWDYRIGHVLCVYEYKLFFCLFFLSKKS